MMDDMIETAQPQDAGIPPVSSIKPGSIVMLKSGGPAMTVFKVDGDDVDAAWFGDPNNFPIHCMFRADQLADIEPRWRDGYQHGEDVETVDEFDPYQTGFLDGVQAYGEGSLCPNSCVDLKTCVEQAGYRKGAPTQEEIEYWQSLGINYTGPVSPVSPKPPSVSPVSWLKVTQLIGVIVGNIGLWAAILTLVWILARIALGDR